MKIEVGYGNTIYGTVEATKDGLKYAGDHVPAMQSLIESIQRSISQDDEALLTSLPEHLNGRVWARLVTGKEKPAQNKQPRQPPGPPTWKEGPQLPPEVLKQLDKKGR